MNDAPAHPVATPTAPRGSVGEVFVAFLKLGLTSFGGPIAHLGYFRDELVVRRRWLDEAAYVELVALCQFLPGPASSQVGFALGLQRAGWGGALAAWMAFTLPSALLMLLFALGAASLGGPLGSGLINGLKIVAVAIVAHAVWGMARTLCPDRERIAIALGAVWLVAFLTGSVGQLGAIVLGGIAGTLLFRTIQPSPAAPVFFPLSPRVGFIAGGAFVALLVLLPLFTFIAGSGGSLALFDAFYRAGALVFGGGHVVLPLLETEVVHTGRIGADEFLAGYGAAQALPGPLFTFAAYLGALADMAPGAIVGAIIALVAIFVPGLLILIALLPFWNRLRNAPRMQAALRGTNAAVVGILAAALYDPVFTSAVASPAHFALALAGFIALSMWKMPPWAVVVLCALAGPLLPTG